MTSDIKFKGFKPVKPSSLKWDISIANYCDTASIVLPAVCRFIDKDKVYSNIPTGQKIIEGTPVEIFAGYDGKNDLQFKGFVSRINFKVPVEIECEGYSYQLKRKMINKSFGKTTVKEVLNYLIAGTDIKISKKCPERIEFMPVTFKNVTALQVLDYLKDKYLLTVFFEFDELYVGWRATYQAGTAKLRLNWNTVKDDDLLFQTYAGSIVHIELESRKKTGDRKKVKAKNVTVAGGIKKVKTAIDNDADKQLAANDLQVQQNQIGYTGKITAFLKPFIRPGMTVEIIDNKYQERNGIYFVEATPGSFDDRGGRQNINIGFALSKNG